MSEGDVRIVLMGKTGAGKSSLGNTLLGTNRFTVCHGLSSGTIDLQVEGADRFGTFIQVTDTPGLCDTHRDEDEVLDELRNSIFNLHPGPHIILLVLRCDVRFTDEEYSVYTSLKNLFGQQISDYMIVVFNGLDVLVEDGSLADQRRALDEEVQGFSGHLEEILEDVDYRYYGVSNKVSHSARDKSAAVLIEMIEDRIAYNYGRYIGHESTDEEEGSDAEEGIDSEEEDDDHVRGVTDEEED